MIEEIGTITAVDQDHIWVEAQIKTTCSACQANDNCGTGVVAKAFAPKTEKLILRCTQPARVGQRVKLGIPEQQLLHASALVYLLPLVVLIITSLIGQSMLPLFNLSHELWVVGLSVAATLASFYWVRGHIRRDTEYKYCPRLLALLPLDGKRISVRQ